jgi:hypothetical protein
MSDVERKLFRREFLSKTGRTITGAVLAAGPVALGARQQSSGQSDDDLDRYDFLMPRVEFQATMRVGDRWNCFPGGDRNLLLAFRQEVRCEVKLPPNCRDDRPHHGTAEHFNAIVDFNDSEPLRKYPFLFMTSSGPYRFNDRQKIHFRRYLKQGGFVLMDDCVHRNESLFYHSSYEMLEDVFGAGAVKRIPNSHEVFHNVFDLGTIGLPYVQGEDQGARGVFVGERLAVFLSSTDIHCGWADRGRPNAHKAVEMGVNIIMYALSH